MKLKSRYIFVVFVLSLALQSCSWLDRKAVAKLDIAEEQMKEYPDSSLTILSSINPENLCKRKNRARYALLLTQAQDKNYIDKTDDSLISIAVDYYSWKEDYANLFLALYYKGRIHSNSKDYINAMLAYTQAEELADYSSDNYAKGLLYAHLGLLHYDTYDFSKSFIYYQKAYDFYRQAGQTILQQYTKVDMGQALIKMQQYDDAERLIVEAMEWFYDNNHDSACQNCVQTLVFLYKEIGAQEKLNSLHTSKYAEGSDNTLCTHLTKAYLYALDHNRSMAEKHLYIAQQLTTNQQDSITLIYENFHIQKALGNHTQALELYEELFFLQDSILRHTLQQPLSSVQKEYFQAQAKEKELRLTGQKMVQIYTIIVFILILSLIYLYFRHYTKVKEMEINRHMELSHNLKDTLFDKSAEMSHMELQIQALFVKQFELLDTLSSTYYETHGTKQEQNAIYNCVKREISKLQNSRKSIQQLEQIIDQYKCNVMTLMRSEIPEFREMEYRLLCFCYAGFSAKTISIFTNDSVANIYMKKSRLKTKIMQSNAPHKDVMINLLP